MKTGLMAVALALVGMFSGVAGAETSGYENARVYGQGSITCGKFVEAVNQAKAGDSVNLMLSMQWMAGNASAYSLDNNVNLFKEQDLASVQLWLTNYCQANPLENFSMAVFMLFAELDKSSQ